MLISSFRVALVKPSFAKSFESRRVWVAGKTCHNTTPAASIQVRQEHLDRGRIMDGHTAPGPLLVRRSERTMSSKDGIGG